MISVIITTYKREPSMVLRAISSIISQTYQDIELIVVDDSPDDYALRSSVESTVKEQGKQSTKIEVRYIPHEKNLGACAARNTGLNASKGEYIAFLDDDDEWLPNKLEKQLKVMEQTEAGLVYCGCYIKDDINGTIRERKAELYRGMVFDRLIFHNFIASTSFPLIRKECILAAGGFDTKMLAAQDYDVWLRIAEKFIVDYVAEPLVIYHEHGSEQISTNPQKKINGLERLNAKYKVLLDSNPSLWRCRNIALIPYYVQVGDIGKALKLWGECASKKPGAVIENIRFFLVIIKGIRCR